MSGLAMDMKFECVESDLFSTLKRPRIDPERTSKRHLFDPAGETVRWSEVLCDFRQGGRFEERLAPKERRRKGHQGPGSVI